MKLKTKRPVLEITKLAIWRGETEILKKISWTVNSGEHWVILGGNGSGKTSLLSALMGYFTPSAGDIDLLGKRFGESDWPTLRRRIGIVSSAVRQMMADSEPALHSVASGKFAMIDFWGEPKRADLTAARKILKDIECEHLAERPWAVLSQGERQRVLIGRALMTKPAVLILDEPCAGLDPIARENFLQFVERLGRKANSPTLIFVTHHVEEIRPVMSHALLLRNGEIIAAGPRNEVLTDKNLTRTFGAPVQLVNSKNQLQLRIRPKTSVVV